MGRKLNKKGVSLAELLAVVVIMGIIAAIAIPLVGNVIETSKKKAFLGDLVTVTEAARTYCLVEGKPDSTDPFCKNHEYLVTTIASTQSEPSVPENTTISSYKGKLIFGSSAGGGQDILTAAKANSISTKLDKYMSKTKANIAAGDIDVVQVNNKFYIAVTGLSKDKFRLGTKNDGTEFVDPTDPDALDNILDEA